LVDQLEEQISRTFSDAVSRTHAPSALLRTIISKAAAYFAFRPDDFGLQSDYLLEGHAVFGGTNRLLWSLDGGFRPDPSYCSPRFLAQFPDRLQEIGRLNTRTDPPSITLSGAAGSVLYIPTGWGNDRHTIFGRKDKHGRITEVSFWTGMSEISHESHSSQQAQPAGR